MVTAKGAGERIHHFAIPTPNIKHQTPNTKHQARAAGVLSKVEGTLDALQNQHRIEESIAVNALNPKP